MGVGPIADNIGAIGVSFYNHVTNLTGLRRKEKKRITHKNGKVELRGRVTFKGILPLTV